ncbi:MAG: membrane protein insertase YidC [Rickettsiales bacterium]|jgi:YidC/Oxa1 family membrane protein insertase|nr:membrane protein insertase YidC [Rickettsiales bacterium]
MKNINPEDDRIKNDRSGQESKSKTGQRSLIRTLTLFIFVFTVNDLVIIRPLMRKVAEQQRERAISESNTSTEDSDDNSEEVLIELSDGEPTSGSNGVGTKFLRPRYVFLENEHIKLRMDTKGLVLDSLFLKKYNDETGNVRLLEPKKSTISIGWQSISKDPRVPNENSFWAIETRERGEVGSGDRKITLVYGTDTEKFRVRLSIDEKYMLNVEQSVENSGNQGISLSPLWQIRRKNPRIKTKHEMFHFSGGLGVFDGKIQEIKPKRIKNANIELSKTSWAGVTSQYWLMALIADSTVDRKAIFSERKEAIRVQLTSPEIEEVRAGSSVSANISIFAGAKDLGVLKGYSKSKNIKLFDRSVDFGLFHFLARPLNGILNFLYRMTRNFGLAIVLLTVFIKIVLYPVVKKAFITMDLMKDIQPKLKTLQAMYGKDSEKFRHEVTKMYRKYDLNPFASIVPIVVQIPVFFSLYRVISVSLNMRQAPFFWFIRDLSSADPTNILNLFGLLPYTRPRVGLLPCIMALTMYLQQTFHERMMGTPQSQPKSTMAINSSITKFMPLVFMFVFSSFPSGLLLYWILNNVITVIQQYYIFKNVGDHRKKRGNWDI